MKKKQPSNVILFLPTSNAVVAQALHTRRWKYAVCSDQTHYEAWE